MRKRKIKTRLTKNSDRKGRERETERELERLRERDDTHSRRILTICVCKLQQQLFFYKALTIMSKPRVYLQIRAEEEVLQSFSRKLRV